MNLGKRVALIGPRFFSYLEAIRVELEKKDVFAITADDIHSQSIAWRIIYRLGLKAVYQRELRRYNHRLLLRLKEQKINHVLFVNCETYDDEFLDACERENIKISVYFWDALKNKPVFAKYIKRFDRVASFDPGDCDSFNLLYIPLFAEHDFFESSVTSTKLFDACMVSTIHSSRALWANELYRLEKDGAMSVNVFPFFSSKWLYFVRNIFQPRNLALLPHIKTVPLKKSEVADIFKKSRDVVDVHHFKQRGLTSRTFEALAAGARLITTNADVCLLPKSLQNRICVVKSPSDLRHGLAKLQQLPPLSNEERYFLSIKRFADDLTALIDGEANCKAITE